MALVSFGLSYSRTLTLSDMTRAPPSSPDLKPAPSSAKAAASPTTHGAIGERAHAVSDVVSGLSGMSLSGHDTGNRTDVGVARRLRDASEVVSPLERTPIVPQTVVNITIHAHNSPVHVYTAPTSATPDEGARMVGRVLRGSNTIQIPPPRRILRATAATAPPAIPPTQMAAEVPPHPPQGEAISAGAPESPHLQSLPETPVGLGNLPQLALAADTPPQDSEEVGEQDEHIAPADPAYRGKWYAVTAGRKVGVWQDWLQIAPHVLNVSGNQYKSFASRTEALHWYYTSKIDGNVVVVVP